MKLTTSLVESGALATLFPLGTGGFLLGEPDLLKSYAATKTSQ